MRRMAIILFLAFSVSAAATATLEWSFDGGNYDVVYEQFLAGYRFESEDGKVIASDYDKGEICWWFPDNYARVGDHWHVVFIVITDLGDTIHVKEIYIYESEADPELKRMLGYPSD